MADYTSNIFEAVDSIVSQRIDSTPIDLTITATIARLHNVAIGEYKVTYQGNTFSAYAMDPLTVYRQGQEVYVLVPKGDYSSQKMILGEAAYNDKVTYADRQAMQNQWRTRGPNWLSKEWYWRDIDGGFTRGDARDAGIVVKRQGTELGAGGEPGIGSNAAWRRYVFYRPDILLPPQKEEGTTPDAYTDARWKTTRFNGPIDPNVTTKNKFSPAGITALERVDSDLQQWGMHLDYIMVSANFKTLLMNNHSAGEYGVLVECYVDNPRFGLDGYDDEPRYLITSFRLGFGDFNGARYSFAQATPQRAVFQVPRNVIKGLVRVSLYQTNGWETDIDPDPTRPDISFVVPNATYVTERDNIFAEDISIHWCEPINLTDRLFWIKVDAVKGTSLYNTGGDGTSASWIERIPLRARLMYGSKDVTDRENCKFVWYRQKYSALRSAAEGMEKDEYGNTWAGYLPEGEQGWAPITLMRENMFTPETPGNPFAEHDPALGDLANYQLGSFPSETSTTVINDTFHEGLIVPIEKVPWKWKYMVVCYYNPGGGNLETITRSNHNDALIWETEEVRNLSSIHDFELPEAFITNLSNLNLRVRNNTVPWEDGVIYDVFNPDTPDPEKDWWCRWWALEGRSYLPMEDSTSLLDDELRYVKGKKRIDHWATNSPITFKAQIFGDRTIGSPPVTPSGKEAAVRSAARWMGVSQSPKMELEYPQFELANVERTLVPDNDAMVHVQFHGDLAHYYNSDGSLRDFGSDAETQYNIWATVTPRDNTVRIFSVEWVTPDGARIPTKQTDAYTMPHNNGMCRYIWVSDPDQRKMVHYKVDRTYDIDKVATERNTFKLRVRFVGAEKFVDFECPITFITADGNGANGTEWEATIWPTNETNTLDGETVESRTPWTWDIQNHPRPLVTRGNFIPNNGDYSQNNEYKLHLRPFIKRKNVPIESLTEAHRYTYKVYWDVRYPKVKADSDRGKASGGSFLKLKQVTNRGGSDLGRDGGTTGTPFIAGPSLAQPGEYFQAYTHSRDQQGLAWNGDGDADGAKPWPPTNQTTYPRTYGAIEVQWAGRDRITPESGGAVTFAQLDYSFVVKAQIDIFYDNKKVQTIFSYHGVDVMFSNGLDFLVTLPNNPTPLQREFRPRLIKTTWPKDVKYSPTGIAPSSRNEFLQFYYGPNATAPLDGPPPHPISAYPENLTPRIQDLTINGEGYNPRGQYVDPGASAATTASAYRKLTTFNDGQDLTDVVSYMGNWYKVRTRTGPVPNAGITDPPDPSSLNDPNWIRITDVRRQSLMPRPFYFFEEFDNGALATDLVFDTGMWPVGATHNPDFVSWHNNPDLLPRQHTNTARYVRTIVYRLSQFANDDINGWDGKSIDLDEKNGTIFAPTIGAGWKHPFTNTFTGVIMGIDKSQLRSAYQDDYGGFSGEAVDQMRYMVGLYGYQDGVNSFGILENGTAFFGRADRGGRIIIDGFNAQIYGGTGIERKTGLEADMRNRMRLSFIDFGGIANQMTDDDFNNANFASSAISWHNLNDTYQDYLKTVNWDRYGRDKTYQALVDYQLSGYRAQFDSFAAAGGPRMGMSVDDAGAIILGPFFVDQSIQNIMKPTRGGWFGNFNYYFAPGIGVDRTDPLAMRYSGYYTGNTFSTPAIEIGSYEDWMKDENGNRRVETRSEWLNDPRRRSGDTYRRGYQLTRFYTIKQIQSGGISNNVKELEIPGFRRFLVTYDGTLYAMNAFIKGNIIGSNIIGSQFFNDDGSFALTEDGNLGVGGNSTGWNIEKYVTAYAGRWSGQVPTWSTRGLEFHLNASDEQVAKGEYLDGRFNFFVSRTGKVLAKEIHIAGGSISIGDFHVIGSDSPDTETGQGDVVSFGTMYLVGRRSGMPTIGSSTAVEAWGDFYLRGKLTNLGPVFLGGTPEKTASGDLVANQRNSPFSMRPNTSSFGNDDQPRFPVRTGLWPLYFYNATNALTYGQNGAWVTLSGRTDTSPPSGTTYNAGDIPSFSYRPSRDFTGDGREELANNVMWRLDQLGMWTDGIIFTRKSWTGNPTDEQALSFGTHGLLYQGWMEFTATTGTTWAFTIKNVSNDAPTTIMEARQDIRISSGKNDSPLAGRGQNSKPVRPNQVVIDAWEANGQARVSAIVVGAGFNAADGENNRIAMNSHTIALVAKNAGDSNGLWAGSRAFLFLNGVGSSGTITDELGRPIAPNPGADNNALGRIWMKAEGIALDGAENAANVATTNNISTIRINRSWSGADDSGGMPVNAGGGTTGRNFIGINSGTVMIKSRGTGTGFSNTVHILTDGEDNGAGTNEIYMAATGGLIRLSAVTELSLGVNSAGHDLPTNALIFRATELRVQGYTAEQQHGIYARFA